MQGSVVVVRDLPPAETDCGTGMVPVDGDVDVIGEPVHQGQPAATVAGCGGATDRGR